MAAAQNMRGFAFCCHNPFQGDDFTPSVRMHYNEFPTFLSLYQQEKEYCAKRFPQPELTLNMETDWVPGQEERVISFVRDSLGDFDCVLGSLHCHGRKVDRAAGALQFVKEYYDNWVKAVRSGCFQVMTHMDYWRVETGWDWAVRNRKDIVPIVTNALKELRDENREREGRGESPISVEVNTGGLQYDSEVFMPARYILEIVHDMGIPVCLSSDCHDPSEVGRHFGEALDFLRSIGSSTLSYYRKKTMFTYSLEDAIATYHAIDPDEVLRKVQADPELANPVEGWKH